MQRRLTLEHVYAWLKYHYRVRGSSTEQHPDWEEWSDAMEFMPDDLLNFLGNEYTETNAFRVACKQENEHKHRVENFASRARRVLNDRADRILLETKQQESDKGIKDSDTF